MARNVLLNKNYATATRDATISRATQKIVEKHKNTKSTNAELKKITRGNKMHVGMYVLNFSKRCKRLESKSAHACPQLRKNVCASFLKSIVSFKYWRTYN